MSDDAPGGTVVASVLIPVRNEEQCIRRAVETMLAQQCDGPFELLFIDGRSSDGTREILQELARGEPRMRILDNPARTTPHALNIGLNQARGEFVARMDAHTLFPPHYLARGIERLQRGDVACVTGPAVPYGIDAGSNRTALALRSWAGTGGSPVRHARDRETEVGAGPFGIWKRSTLEALGGWDVEWPINQDAELAARMRKAGGRIVMLPELEARYIPRSGLRALAHQYARYGFFRAKTSLKYPETVRLSYALPPAVFAASAAAVAGPRTVQRPIRRLMLAYGVLLVGFAGRSARAAGLRDAAWLPSIFFVMHASWGAGVWVGLLRNLPLVPGWPSSADEAYPKELVTAV
jgi:glycosyltransferase involved in cell wall biosynthesis